MALWVPVCAHMAAHAQFLLMLLYLCHSKGHFSFVQTPQHRIFQDAGKKTEKLVAKWINFSFCIKYNRNVRGVVLCKWASLGKWKFKGLFLHKQLSWWHWSDLFLTVWKSTFSSLLINSRTIEDLLWAIFPMSFHLQSKKMHWSLPTHTFKHCTNTVRIL